MKISIRRGLTLIELTVVLLILAATAGILVPRLVGYSGRAHGSAGASNVQEITKAISLFETNKGRFPSNWDSLQEGAAGVNVYAGLVNTGVTSPLNVAALTDAERAAINDLGIASAQILDTHATPTNTDYNATFNPYPAAVGSIDYSVTGTPNAALLTDPTVVGGVAGDRIVVLGLGTQSEMIGEVMTDAPVHFPESGDKPEDVYLRYVACFQVNDGANTREKAKFLGVFAVEPGSGEFKGTGAHLAEFYENRDQ